MKNCVSKKDTLNFLYDNCSKIEEKLNSVSDELYTGKTFSREELLSLNCDISSIIDIINDIANVIDFIFGTSIKQKIDEEKNKIEIVESIPCLAGVKIKHNDKDVIINLDNILDSEKIKYFNEINELKNKKIQFKEYNFLNEHDFIFINFK